MKRQHRVLLVFVAAVMTAAMAFALCACSTKEDDKIYVGLECAYAPFNYTQNDNSNGAVQIYNTNYAAIPGSYANGYDVMIASEIAKSMGKELVVVKMTFESLIPALNAGTVDFIIAGMSPTAERLKSIDFSEPYYRSNLVLVVRLDGDYAAAEDLNDFAGARVAAQIGTFHNDALQAQAATYGILPQTPMDDFPALINALKTGAIDAYVAEEPGAIENCASNPEFTYIHLQNNVTGFDATDADTAIAVGLVKNSPVKQQIDAILAGISQSQREQMMQKAIQLASGSNVTE